MLDEGVSRRCGCNAAAVGLLAKGASVGASTGAAATSAAGGSAKHEA